MVNMSCSTGCFLLHCCSKLSTGLVLFHSFTCLPCCNETGSCLQGVDPSPQRLLGQALEGGALHAAVQLGETEQSATDGGVPHGLVVHWCVRRALGWAGLAAGSLTLTFTGTCFKDRVIVSVCQVGSCLSLEEEGREGKRRRRVEREKGK